MKNTILALLALILVLVIVNLLATFGIFGGGSQGVSHGGGSGGSYEYKALAALQMDDIGFRAIAEEEGIEVSEDGEINFPQEMVDKIAKFNMLPRTITEVEKDGGWEFVAVTADNHYLFRRAK